MNSLYFSPESLPPSLSSSLSNSLMHLSLFRYFQFPGQIYEKCFQLDRTLKGLCFSGRFLEAVELLCFKSGSSVDPQTYALLLQESINRKEHTLGRRIHAHMITVGFTPDEYLKTKLVILYAKDGDLQSAHQLFDKILQRSIIPWNAMISGYVKKGLDEDGLNIYHLMRSTGLQPDQFTFASVFRACAGMAALEHGKQVHGTMVKTPIVANVVVNSALVDMYFKCSSPDDGRRAFDGLPERNTVTWTALISGYGKHGQVIEVLELFHRMIDEGFRPNYVTFLALLSACSHGGLIDEGWRYFNSMARDYRIRPRGEHYAAMVDLLGRAGKLDEAYEFVTRSPSKKHKHPVVWGALLGACMIHGDVRRVKLAAKQFFELEPENAGKYIVLSNTYAAIGMWENVLDVREMIRRSGIRKEPGWSSVEVRGEVHTFLAGEKTHEQNDKIDEMIRGLGCTLLAADSLSVPNIETM